MSICEIALTATLAIFIALIGGLLWVLYKDSKGMEVEGEEINI